MQILKIIVQDKAEECGRPLLLCVKRLFEFQVSITSMNLEHVPYKIIKKIIAVRKLFENGTMDKFLLQSLYHSYNNQTGLRT